MEECNIKCICPNIKCEHHGKCNDCIKSHLSKKTPVYCLCETTRRNY